MIRYIELSFFLLEFNLFYVGDHLKVQVYIHVCINHYLLPEKLVFLLFFYINEAIFL